MLTCFLFLFVRFPAILNTKNPARNEPGVHFYSNLFMDSRASLRGLPLYAHHNVMMMMDCMMVPVQM